MLDAKTNTFLAQSYQDAWADYRYSVENEKGARWDWVAVTASDEEQAIAYRTQLQLRQAQGCLPKNTRFIVAPDPEGLRVGSGGATLEVLRQIAAYSAEGEKLDALRILTLHSGGDSKRTPQYSACGKLFAPMPRLLPDGRRSTLFDEILISVSGVPNRVKTGMLVMSGDTLILFNPLQLDLKFDGAAALSIKTNVREGTEHGVYVCGQGNDVAAFLHKQAETVLREAGAVNEDGLVDVDTGNVWLGAPVVRALLRLITTNGEIDTDKCQAYINTHVRLSFYADFQYPMAKESTMDTYARQTPEGEDSPALQSCRKTIWELLNGIPFKLVRLSPAYYLHVGTTWELFDFFVKRSEAFPFLGWERSVLCNQPPELTGAVNNCAILTGAQIDRLSYLENCYIGSKAVVGRNTILSSVRLEDEVIPPGVVLHCLRMKDGRFAGRIYGVEDNPKASAAGRFLDTTLQRFVAAAGVSEIDVWPAGRASLWNAAIYPVCHSQKEAVAAALSVWRIAQGTASAQDLDTWRAAERTSLWKSFTEADVLANLEWDRHVENLVRAERCLTRLRNKQEIQTALAELSADEDLEREAALLLERAAHEDFSTKIRIYLALSDACKAQRRSLCGKDAEDFENLCYDTVREETTAAVRAAYPVGACSFHKSEASCNLPVRVNFCGSPSDAAPYCLEYGGTMIDAALTLKGKLPIQARIRRLSEPKIVFESFDLRAKMEFTDLAAVRACGDPYDLFALHKAVLVATGVVPFSLDGLDMEGLCSRMGGGLYLGTEVDVPKGSGLGTSSLIAAACVKAVNTAMALDTSDDCVYAQVFSVEQLMNTGGGWQDQVGGMPNGVKFFRSPPGLLPRIKVDILELEPTVLQELQDRFALIFSGQRRLARNVLREEMNQTIRSNPAAMEALERIQQLCVLMRYELERGNVTAFGGYIFEQFELVKRLDKGASNACIEYIFDVCDDLIDGKAITGAGGGGFLQVILKKGVTKAQLRRRIREVFGDCGVEVWECALI